jgi:hypothetical protein
LSEEDAPARAGDQLWPGDKGLLPEASRRTLVALLKGPYVSAERQSGAWDALMADQAAIESRLADLFLDLVVDQDTGVAFIRGVRTDQIQAPQVVRSRNLTFIQTALVLHLRQLQVRAAPGEAVIVGLGEVTDYLEVYRPSQGIDRPLLVKRVKSAWETMHDLGLLHKTSTEERSEVSPTLRLIFGPEEIERLTTEYERIAEAAGGAAGAGRTAGAGAEGTAERTEFAAGPNADQGRVAGAGGDVEEGTWE